MRTSMAVFTTLLAVKALLYLPLAGFAYLSWQSCGRDILASSSMVPIQGVLHEANYVVKPVGRKTRTDVKIAYDYDYEDRRYRSDALTLCPGWTSGSAIDELVEKVVALRPQLGSAVTVWVDPARPEKATLYKYIPNIALAMIAFIGVFGIAFGTKLDRHVSTRVREILAS